MQIDRKIAKTFFEKLRQALNLSALCLLWVVLRYSVELLQQVSAPSPMLNLPLALISGGIAIAVLPLLDREKPISGFLLACLPYVLLNSLYLFSDKFYPGDTFNYHFPVFSHVYEYFQANHSLPGFFPESGGVRAAVYHVNLFPFGPLRLLSLPMALAHLPPLEAYKLQVLAGMLLTGLGFWLFLLKATGDARAAFFGLLAFMPGGATFTLHQEQVLMTMLAAPWLGLCLLNLREKPVCAPIALVLFAFALGTHYPQIQAAALALCALALLAYAGKNAAGQVFTAARGAGKAYWAAAVLLSVLALWPMFYVGRDMKDMSSPMRQSRTLERGTYGDYYRINTLQDSSKPARELLNYLHPSPDSPDSFSYFCGRPAVLAAVLGALFFPARLAVPALLTALFLLLSMGVNTPLPKLLFALHLPFIAVFRQWFHFFPFANMALAMCAALSAKLLFARLGEKKAVKLLFGTLLFAQAADGAFTALRYADMTSGRAPLLSLPPLMFEIKPACGPAHIMQYSARAELAGKYPQRIPAQPETYAKILLRAEGGAGLADTALAVEQGLPYPVLDISLAQLKTLDPLAEVKEISGGLLEAGLSKQAVVLPFNYDMGWSGGEVRIFRADGALCAAILENASQRFDLEPGRDSYPLSAALASAVFLLAAGAALLAALKKPISS